MWTIKSDERLELYDEEEDEVSATCMAGALSYLSQAMTYCPARFAAMVNSLPSSPEPKSI